ncbi:mechanosensitive ion channel [Flavivirga amylovorans]|uniref:Mechanosensitive ion channel n=1 Tax=Flavivirga amylovorans TaxID=870486 RepID=A0ABT8X6Z5_9FLAO|nr:mechanosensitive ion channel domain-containing protein [Flavivirga amylovorans]MDO5989749.1 mechanosensitive ion channel [Flavivirga amylovorans]
MDLKTKLALILLLIVVLTLVVFLTKKALIRFSLLKSIEPHRRKIVGGLIYSSYYLIALFVILIIVGVDFNQFGLFASSVLAVLGISFFAQWSMLSNLTASVILFFYHPLRIGSRIKILDSEINFCGTVKDITGFYVLMKTDDERIITIPNTTILYKGIELIN